MKKQFFLHLFIFLGLLMTAQTKTSTHSKVTRNAQYPRVAAISDIHVGRNGWEGKVKTALTILTQQQPKPDAIFIVGDITENGKSDEFLAAKTKIDEWTAGIPVYYLLGNHDWWGPGKGDNINAADVFKNVFGQDVNQYIIIKEYPFILLSMETQSQANAYRATTRAFLSEKLSDAATRYSGKPIFVLQHIPNSGTVYGSYEIGGNDSWGCNNIDDILRQYPQVVSIAGHSHFFLADERSIHQDKYTSINDGSIAYAETENGLEGGARPVGSEQIQEGIVISMDQNNDITVKRYDLRNNVEIKQPWIIKAPHDGSMFTYKNRDGGTAPYFEAGARIELKGMFENYACISFPVAKDDDVVQHYRVEVLNSSKELLPSPVYKILSKFYLYGNNEQAVNLNISGLEKNMEFYVQVTAVDAFGKKSAPPLLSEKFKTNNYTPLPVEAPKANLIDVRFRADTVFNKITDKSLVVEKGPGHAPVLTYDSSIKQYVSSFARSSANTQTFYKIDYQQNTDFVNAISQAFTFEVYARTKGKEEMSSVSSLQSGGFGLEQVSGGGATRFWLGSASSSSDVKKIGDESTLSPIDYYHIVVTFDGSNASIYYNSRQGEMAQLPDGIRLSNTKSAQWIAIGGDASPNDVAQGAFSGDIALFRMYDKALSRDEIHALYQQLTSRKNMEEFDELHTLISHTLPDFQKNTSGDLAVEVKKLLSEGWQLMDAYATTREDIAEFLTKAKQLMGIQTPVYSGNLFINPGFELSSNMPAKLSVNPTAAQYPERWNLTVTNPDGNDGEVHQVSDAAYQGNASMKVELRKLNARYRFYLSYDMPDVEPGVYQYSFYSKAGRSDIPFRVEMVGYESVGSGVGKMLLLTGDKDGVQKQTNTDWVKYTFNIDLSNVAAKDLKVLRFYIRPNCFLNGSVSDTPMEYWFDNFSFRKDQLTSSVQSATAGNPKINIYPNLLRGGEQLFIETNQEGQSITTATLYNLSGVIRKKSKFTGTCSSMRMPVTPGAYILVVSNAEATRKFKLIVK